MKHTPLETEAGGLGHVLAFTWEMGWPAAVPIVSVTLASQPARTDTPQGQCWPTECVSPSRRLQ